MAKKDKIKDLEEQLQAAKAELARLRAENNQDSGDSDNDVNSILSSIGYEAVGTKKKSKKETAEGSSAATEESDLEAALKKRREFALAEDTKMRAAAIEELDAAAEKAGLASYEVANLHRIIATAHPDDVCYTVNEVKRMAKRKSGLYEASLRDLIEPIYDSYRPVAADLSRLLPPAR